MTLLHELARAKVNLTLHVAGRRPDGYHELASLVAFADWGDDLMLDTAGPAGLTVEGPFASRLEGPNLVQRAIDAVLAAWPGARSGRVRLTKQLPVAAGLGGGSADAAACLRLLARANAALPAEPDWAAVGRGLGADVPVCLASRLSHMAGTGEVVTRLPLEAALPAILVNPMVPLATAAVFRELGAAALRPGAGQRSAEPRTPGELLDAVGAGRNDLEPPAIRLCPVIAEVLDELRFVGGACIARLSGSGPTCFALMGSGAEAAEGAAALQARRPGWWIRAVTLG